MYERRYFLKVLGGTAVTLFGCGSSNGSGSPASGGHGSGATGGFGASGGAAGASGAAGAAGAAGSCNTDTGTQGYNSDHCHSPAGRFDVGMPSDFPNEGLYKLLSSNSRVMIGRDANGLWAMSSLCTHQCCDMNGQIQGQDEGTILSSGGQPIIRCNCHGSRFAADGSVLLGPATEPLNNYVLTLECDGHLYVDTSQVVDPSTRLSA